MPTRRAGIRTEVIEVRLKQYWNGKMGTFRDCIELDCGHAVFADHDETNASLVGALRVCHGEHSMQDKR